MERISSKDNKTIKHVSKLIKESKYRKSQGLFVIEGIRLCDDAIRSNASIEMCIYSEDALNRYPEVIKRYETSINKVFCCDNSIFCGISDTKTPQGVLFVVKSLDKSTHVGKINKDNGIILALESIQDPSNLGTILRSAEAFGVDRVVLSKDCCDVYSPKVVRGSMGAIFRVQIEIVDDLCEYILMFNETGHSYAAVLDENSESLSKLIFSGSNLAVIGNEGNGLSSEVINACSNKLFIDMKGDAESLNASVAASIILWELSKK